MRASSIAPPLVVAVVIEAQSVARQQSSPREGERPEKVSDRAATERRLVEGQPSSKVMKEGIER
jgi:hypothetical protein